MRGVFFDLPLLRTSRHPAAPVSVQSVYGMGYRFEPSLEPPPDGTAAEPG